MEPYFLLHLSRGFESYERETPQDGHKNSNSFLSKENERGARYGDIRYLSIFWTVGCDVNG